MNEERNKRNPVTWQPVAAFACFVGAVLSLAIGFVLTTEWVLNAQLHPMLHGIGLTLLILGIPILILGGHCLDLMERKVSKSVRDLSPQRNGRSKPLHAVVGLVGLLCVLAVVPATVKAQPTNPIRSRGSNSEYCGSSNHIEDGVILELDNRQRR